MLEEKTLVAANVRKLVENGRWPLSTSFLGDFLTLEPSNVFFLWFSRHCSRPTLEGGSGVIRIGNVVACFSPRRAFVERGLKPATTFTPSYCFCSCFCFCSLR